MSRSEWIGHLLGLLTTRVDVLEHVLSIVGGFIGIFLVFHISHTLLGETVAVWMLASMGASAVLLFGVPHAAFAQPWPLFAGHGISALIGVSCAHWIGDTALAAACAVGLALGAMHLLRCIHPPGGATALVAVIGGSSISTLGFQYVLTPVLLNVAILFVVALLFNAPFAWRRYPLRPNQLHTNTAQSPVISPQALEQAMDERHTVIDVTPEELLEIAQRAVELSRDNHPDASTLHTKVWRITKSI